MLQKLLGTSNSFAPLFMRLALGAFMLPHGLQKTIGCFEGKGFSTTLNDFQASGMPLPVAVLVILGESLGALGLIFGCITRFCAFGIFLIMCGAIWMVHGKNGWLGEGGYQWHILAIGLSLGLMILGGGKYSIDQKLTGKG